MGIFSRIEDGCMNRPARLAWESIWQESTRRLFVVWALLCLLALLTGCANSGKFLHSVHLSNHGTVAVYDVDILYGQEKVTMKRIRPAGRATGFGRGFVTPIPETMTVRWRTEEDRQHEISVPVRERISRAHRVSSLLLRFKDDRIEVWQRLEFSTPPEPGRYRDELLYP